jgi:hypothetical protein
MSISMGMLGAEGQYATYDAHPSTARRLNIYQLQCRGCGYESGDAVAAPRICPKCRSASWERFILPGVIVRNAERYGG